MRDKEAIHSALQKVKSGYPREILFPTQDPRAFDLIMGNPYAFCVAGCLDRGTKAEIIWTIPFWISQQTGYFDPFRFYQLLPSEVERIFQLLPRKPRYLNAAPRTFIETTKIIVEQFDGKAEHIWHKKTSIEVKRTFLSIYGVGSGIANMLLLLIEEAFGETFEDLERSNMDIKPDVHTMRVLYRLGLASAIDEVEAMMAARKLNPRFPGDNDGPLWHVGKTWCYASQPNCIACPIEKVCEKVGVL